MKTTSTSTKGYISPFIVWYKITGPDRSWDCWNCSEGIETLQDVVDVIGEQSQIESAMFFQYSPGVQAVTVASSFVEASEVHREEVTYILKPNHQY